MTDDLPRRNLLAAAAIGWGAATAAEALAQPMPHQVPGTIAVTLLGTGSPILVPSRFGPATLVEAGGLRLLFDAGRACTIRLNQVHVPLGAIDAVFLTHYHSDHINGLPDLWACGYIQAPYLGRKAGLHVYGPPGAARLCTSLRAAFADDIRIRMADEGTPEAATAIEPHEFPEDGGTVFDQAGVVVTAFAVDHGPLIRPAVGYRIDHAGRSVLISGDTRFDERVIRHGSGVDLLVHEVCTTPAGLEGFPQARAVSAHHTSPEEAGRVFAQAAPRMAAYTHFVEITRPGFPAVPAPEIERLTRLAWHGPLTIGEDLTRFTVADTIAVERLPMPTGLWPGY